MYSSVFNYFLNSVDSVDKIGKQVTGEAKHITVDEYSARDGVVVLTEDRGRWERVASWHLYLKMDKIPEVQIVETTPVRTMGTSEIAILHWVDQS